MPPTLKNAPLAAADRDESPARRFFRRNAFVLLLISGVAVGIGLGVGLRHAKPVWSPRELAYYKFPGELLLRMLQMMILPLVVTSMISGMSSLGRSASSKIGVRALVYYMSTTLIAVVIGIVLVVSIRPGSYGRSADIQRQNATRTVNAVDSVLDLVRNAIPDNIADACIRRVQTVAKPVTAPRPTSQPTASPGNASRPTVSLADVLFNDTNSTTPPTPTGRPPTTSTGDYVPVLESAWGSNLLGLIVFSIALGIALGRLGDRGLVARQFFDGCSEAVLLVVKLVICDRLRTSINVWGDCVGAGIVEALSLSDLKETDQVDAEEPAAAPIYDEADGKLEDPPTRANGGADNAAFSMATTNL